MSNPTRSRLPTFFRKQEELGLFIRIKASSAQAGAFEVVITSHEDSILDLKTLPSREDALRYTNSVINKAKAKDAEAMIVVNLDSEN
ncbi:MAG: hypothetical protein JWL93_1378 [Hyphomicrobiales bacterium]|nr:hypothetical protein [Hyphomicrobiales bacterium]